MSAPFPIDTVILTAMNEEAINSRTLARRLGVADARVCQMLGGDPPNLTLRSLQRIADALGRELVVELRQ